MSECTQRDRLIPVNVLGFCQGHSEVAKDPTDYGLRRVVLGMHKRLQDMHIGTENLTQQHAYALGMPRWKNDCSACVFTDCRRWIES